MAAKSKETPEALKNRAKKIVNRLQKAYPDSKCSLDFKTPLQLLMATILSAQCTDERVNKVTPALFKKYKSSKAFAAANPEELEEMVRSTGFYRNKAKSILKCAATIEQQHGGKMPETMEALVKLPGVGRKTANVLLGNVFGVPGIVVDTHVKRLSGRLGLTANTDPVKIEQDLNPIIPQKDWTIFSHRLIDHGRAVCQAKKPACDECILADLCPAVS
jgi:endonuclease III